MYLCHYKSSLSCATPKIELSPGETVMISAGTPHVFTAIRNKQARGLVVAAPSAFARLVATVRTQERANPLDIELFDRISAEIGDETLGRLEPYPLLPLKCSHWEVLKKSTKKLNFLKFGKRYTLEDG